MTRSYRRKLDILVEMLKLIRKGVVKKTPLMYELKLSWSPISTIVDSAIDNELIVGLEDPKGGTYFDLTEKGEQAIEYYDKLQQLVS